MMDIVKKNLLSIICGVVALAAIAVAFLVVPGRAEALKTQLEARKAAHDAMASLVNKERTLPAPDASDPTPKPLNRFPSDPVIKQGEAIVVQLEKGSVALRDAAVAMNKHELLVPRSLPNPGQVQAYEFRNAYQRALPALVAAVAPGAAPTGGVLASNFAKTLNAGMPPTPDVITAKLTLRAQEIREKEAFILSNGQIGNQQALDLRLQEMNQKLPGQLRDAVAGSSRVYVSADTFEVHPQFAQAGAGTGGGAPDPFHIYFAQLSYWLQQDVVNAVNEINKDSKSVKESPVKHLISIRAKTGGIPTFVTPLEGQANGDPDATLPKAPTISPTARVCNGLFDVFHFTVKADVQADKVPEFLRGLSHRRFITPMWVDLKAVDNATALSQGHVYGDKPVLNVTAECEILYLRKWNAPLMPKLVRQRLGIPDEPPPGAAPAAPAATPAGDQQPPADGQQPAAAAN